MRRRGLYPLGTIIDGSELGRSYRRAGGITQLGSAQQVFATVAGGRLAAASAVLVADQRRVVLAGRCPETIRQLKVIEPVLLPALRERVGVAARRVDYLIDPRVETPPAAFEAVDRSRRLARPRREAIQTAERLPSGALHDGFVRWMSLTMNLGEERQ